MDEINTPSHYIGKDGMECRKIIKAFGLSFELGNAIKYILRCEKKGNKKKDLQKAIRYLQWEVDEIEAP